MSGAVSEKLNLAAGKIKSQVKSALNDGEFDRKFKLQQKREKKLLQKKIMNILQPNLGSCSHIMAPAAILWLLQSHIGSCSYILALGVIYLSLPSL